MANQDDILARLEALESSRTIDIEDIPLPDLMRKLEQKWRPDAAVLLQPYSITTDQFDTRIALFTSDELNTRIGDVALDGVIRGVVTDAGVASAGIGYTSGKNATGDFTITFGTTMLARPAISCYGIDVSENRLVELATNHFRIKFFNGAGVAMDPTGFFCFSATPTT